MNPNDPRHGTVAGYVAHGKAKVPPCDPCRLAGRLYERNRVARRYLARGPLVIDGTGTRRRLRALVAIGWRLNELDARLGKSRSYCAKLLESERPIHRTTALDIAKLYQELCMTPQEGWVADRQRRWASNRGWAPPLAYDDIDNPDERPKGMQAHPTEARGVDEITIERTLAGDVPKRPLTPAEREIVVRRLNEQGLTDPKIADLTGIDARTVHRIRKRLGIPATDSWRAPVPEERNRSRRDGAA